MAIMNNNNSTDHNRTPETKPEKVPAQDKKKPAMPQRKLKKSEKIALQNILFDTNIKKVMTSDVFLMDMTAKYVSKRMKVINLNYDNMRNTKSTSMFFKYYNQIETCLDDLIKIEEYYTFKQPIPSTYKKILKNKLPEMITQMLNRVWKHTLQKYPFVEPVPEQNIEQYDIVINDMLSYRQHYTENDLSLIDSFYRSVHGDETEDNDNSAEDNT